MMKAATNSYDALPYASYPIKYASPEHLCTTATIMGMSPAPADSCRLLEIGCSSGGHLLPLAIHWPKSQFLGIDLSRVQIEHGQRDVDALSLTNLELRQADILDIDESLGRFDYIICHGVYSWVPTPVQQQILRVCRENLAPQGVAFVSYNTYPGWHENQSIRDMMRYHVQGIEDPHQQVQQARHLLKWLAETVPETALYGKLLRERHNDIQQRRDAYLYHEYLESTNAPEFFWEFMQKASAMGLAYLGDAKPLSMTEPRFLPASEAGLRRVTDPIRREQYFDFLRHRKFRQTLLCHLEVNFHPHLDLEHLGRLYIASSATPVKVPDANRDQQTAFKFPNDVTLSTPEPIFREILTELADAWPDSVLLQDLVDRAAERLPLAESRRKGRAALRTDREIFLSGANRSIFAAPTRRKIPW